MDHSTSSTKPATKPTTSSEPAMTLCKLYLDLLTLLYISNSAGGLSLLQHRLNIHCAWLKSTSHLFRHFLNIGSHFHHLTQFLNKITGKFHPANFHRDLAKLTKVIEKFPDSTPEQHLLAATEAFSFAVMELKISNQIYSDYYSIVSRYTKQRQNIPSFNAPATASKQKWKTAVGSAHRRRTPPTQSAPLPTSNRITHLASTPIQPLVGSDHHKKLDQSGVAHNSATTSSQRSAPIGTYNKKNKSPVKKPVLKITLQKLITSPVPSPESSHTEPLSDISVMTVNNSLNQNDVSTDRDIEGMEYETSPDTVKSTATTTATPPTDKTTNYTHPEIIYSDSQPRDWNIPDSAATTYILGDQDTKGLLQKNDKTTQVVSYINGSYSDMLKMLKFCTTRPHVRNVLFSITASGLMAK